MTNGFDPHPSQPYDRTQLIENEVGRILRDRLEEAIEETLSLVDREEITVEEAKDAYYANSDMGDYLFEDYLEGYDE